MLFRLLFGWDRLQSYTVHESNPPHVDRVDRADALVFVKDGFLFQAALFAPLWLASKQLWLALLGYISVVVALAALWSAFGWQPATFALAIVALHVIIGFESDTLQRLHLDRNGWQMLGAVTGKDALDCERRFFDVWLPGQPLSRVPGAPPANTPALWPRRQEG
jgi:Protein of unknown function (DUF2628)